MSRLKYLPLIILGVFLPYIAGAEMYQWVDAGGVKHYSNTAPPQGIQADSAWAEIKTTTAEDASLDARKAAILEEVEAANRQGEADAKRAKQEKALQEALDARVQEQKALEDSIYRKRRYLKRRGKTDVRKIKRLENEIQALRQNKNANPEKIKRLEAEYEATKKKIYRQAERGRKGTRQEVQRYQELEAEVPEIKE